MEVTGLRLKLADSTVTGNAAVELNRRVPLLAARLESDRLDLRPLLGYDSKTSPEAKKSDRAARKKIFPDTPFAIEILPRFETSVDAKIASLILPAMVAEKFDAKATLKSSRLNVRLIASKIGGGRLSFDLALVPMDKQIDVSTSVIAKSVNLSLMLKGLKIQSAMEGILDLTARLKGRGTSVAALMAGLDGDFIAILSNGRMPLAYLNLIGTDIGSSLVHLLNPFGDPVDAAALNCLVVDFNIAKGQAKSDVLLIDDPRKTLVGLAEVDLKTEDPDVWIETKPKEGIGLEGVGKVSVSLKELTKPFKLSGTLAHPRVELDTMRTAKTIGTAMLGPLGIAWLLVSGSSGKEAPCANALKIAGEGAYEMESGSRDKGAVIK
jgi:AsmA family protein